MLKYFPADLNKTTVYITWCDVTAQPVGPGKQYIHNIYINPVQASAPALVPLCSIPENED